MLLWFFISSASEVDFGCVGLTTWYPFIVMPAALSAFPRGLSQISVASARVTLARVGEAATFARCSQPGVVLASRALAEDPECLDLSGGRVIKASPVDAWHPLASRTDQKEVKGPTLTSLQCVCT